MGADDKSPPPEAAAAPAADVAGGAADGGAAAGGAAAAAAKSPFARLWPAYMCVCVDYMGLALTIPVQVRDSISYLRFVTSS
jgi:hypothetical protein